MLLLLHKCLLLRLLHRCCRPLIPGPTRRLQRTPPLTPFVLPCFPRSIDNIRDLFGHKVSLSMVKKNPICRLGF